MSVEATRRWTEGAWRRAAVYGLGLSGLAASRLLRRRGVEVVGVDRRPGEELDLGGLAGDSGFRLLAGGDPERLPGGLDALVLSPGVPPDRPAIEAARRDGVPVLAEVELAFPLLDGPVVGITGSNGKSTTTAMTAAVLEACGRAVEVCGNIGVPLSARVEGPPGRAFVTELSSFQLEAVATFRPHAAALLNLSPDHLDRYPDLAAYAAAKRNLFRRQREDDVAVLNADDGTVAASPVPSRRRLFSRRGPVEDGCFVEAGSVVEVAPGAPGEELFRAEQVGVPGPHNLENAMAAALLARALGAEREPLAAALAGFPGLPHRLERVGEVAGVAFWNDSKGTNVGATLRSLEGFADGTVHLILGGRAKGGDFAALAPAVQRRARRVYLIGEAAAEIERALAGSAELEASGDLESAVAAAAERAAPGEAVLLSPACASFDRYRDFAARGEHFRRLVAALGGEA